MRRIKATILFLVLLLTVTACGIGGSDSQSLTVYSGRSENFIGPFLADFEAESGVKLNIRYGDSAELAAQILEESENSPADIFISQDAGALGAVAQAGLLKKLPNELLSLVPGTFQASSGQWVGLTGRARVFAYNPKTVTALPSSIDDLTNPSWNSKIGIAPTNSSFQAFVTALRIIRGDEATKNWLTKIVSNNPKLFEKNSQIVEAIDAGQIQLGLVNHYYTWEVSKALGREINAVNGFFGPGDAGNLINVSGAGVFNTSKNQSLANKLIEYLLAEKTQKRFVSETYEYSVLPNVVTPAGQPTLKEIGAPIVNLDSLKDLKQTQELLIKIGLL
jgi:iron(III) transport system substrate-binding protein